MSRLWPRVSELQHVLQAAGGGLACRHPRAGLWTGSVHDKVFTCPWQSRETQNLNAVICFMKINLPRFVYKMPVLVK